MTQCAVCRGTLPPGYEARATSHGPVHKTEHGCIQERIRKVRHLETTLKEIQRDLTTFSRSFPRDPGLVTRSEVRIAIDRVLLKIAEALNG